MKKYRLWLLFMFLFSLTACPVGLDYPLGEKENEEFDKQLIGTWKCTNESAEVIKVEIKANGENGATILVMERGELYALETDKFSGWCTTLENRKFVFFKPEGEEKYFHYEYLFSDKNSFSSNDVSLLVGGVDAVTSTTALRNEVSASMQEADWGTEKLEWVRIN